MDANPLRKASKFLSKHLRHTPEALGLRLQPGGWVGVDELLRACAAQGFKITRDVLDEVVASNDKQRFSFDETGTRMRANQGHSTEVDLELMPQAPPRLLYHGTGAQTAAAILKNGLSKMGRHHVHLSPDVETAVRVGSRHGKPIVFLVDAAAMDRDGFAFYCSANGVWLVGEVPPQYLRRRDSESV